MSLWVDIDTLPPYRHHPDIECHPGNATAFFLSQENRVYRNAKRICGRCPLTNECAEWATTTNQQEGVWGGTTPEERATERKRRRWPA